MSAHVGGGGSNSQDVDLNLAPIIDCFVVLISFLLISAAMLAIGILDAGISAAGKSAKNATPPPITVTINLQKNNRIQIKTSGKESKNFTVSANKAGEWDYAGMTHHLGSIKKRWPKVSAVTVQAENKIAYKDVIHVMNEARQTLPAVMLGGF